MKIWLFVLLQAVAIFSNQEGFAGCDYYQHHDTSQMKLLGAGIRDESNGDVISLACTGTPSEGETLEPDCSCFQIAYLSSRNKQVYLVGETFELYQWMIENHGPNKGHIQRLIYEMRLKKKEAIEGTPIRSDPYKLLSELPVKPLIFKDGWNWTEKPSSVSHKGFSELLESLVR